MNGARNMIPSFYRYSIAVALVFCNISAFSWVSRTTSRTTMASRSSELYGDERHSNDKWKLLSKKSEKKSIEWSAPSVSAASRRQALKGGMIAAGSLPSFLSVLLSNPVPVKAMTEQRCDAVDPRCGADGVLRDTTPKGKPIPRVTNRITHVVQLVIDVGERREEVGFLRFGLYGDDCPRTVRTMLEFLTPIGITGAVDEKLMENSIGIQTSPVSILQGGVVPTICPGQGIEFGVPSQRKAYAKARGLRAAGENFVVQNRPEGVPLESEPSARKHDVAGLVSLPEKGIGYATSSGDVDEAFASAFLITADESSSDLLDSKLRRRVVGQVIDNESMEFLARLSSLPIQKKGPGGKGPPLLKVTVLDVGVQKVGPSNQPPGKKKK